MTKEVFHQVIPHINCLFNREIGQVQQILEMGCACMKETVSITGTFKIEILLNNNCSCGTQTGDSFDRSTTASYCCDANRGRSDNWAQTMDDKSDAFEREVDNANEALASIIEILLDNNCSCSFDRSTTASYCCNAN